MDTLEKNGALGRDGATKCADLSVFTKLKDGKLLITLGPKKYCTFLLKYLTFDAAPRLYLIRLTKLVDKYDLGRSFQIRVNQDQDPILLSNTTEQEQRSLPPDVIMHHYHDPRKPFSLTRPGKKWAEQTRFSPISTSERNSKPLNG